MYSLCIYLSGTKADESFSGINPLTCKKFQGFLLMSAYTDCAGRRELVTVLFAHAVILLFKEL